MKFKINSGGFQHSISKSKPKIAIMKDVDYAVNLFSKIAISSVRSVVKNTTLFVHFSQDFS